MESKLIVDVRGMPDVVWSCRHALAKLLREQADSEVSNAVAMRLREVADKFEVGGTA